MSSENNISENNDESDVESMSSDENFEHENNLELTGQILRNYNVICELGRGAFSIVWLAYSIVNNNFYVVISCKKRHRRFNRKNKEGLLPLILYTLQQ